MIDVPHVLLPYQARWHEDSSPLRVAEKSRRIGWSWSCAAESVLEAAMQNGCDTWYIGYNHDMAKEFIRDCGEWAEAFGEWAEDQGETILEDGGRDIIAFSIKFATGYRITALSSRPTNLRGKEGRIVIDEAAFHSDLKGLLKAAMATTMWGGRNRVDVVSTHNGVDSDFNLLIEEIRAGKREGAKVHTCTLDDAIREGLFKRICLKNQQPWTPAAEAKWERQLRALYGDDASEELDCVPSRSGGTYIHRHLVERAMQPGVVIRLELKTDFAMMTEDARTQQVEAWCDENLRPLTDALPLDKLHFFGEDFGRTSDRTVLAPGYLDQDLTRVHPFAVEMLNVPYDQQRQVCFYLIDRLPRFFAGAMDATGNGGYLAEACSLKYGMVLRGDEMVPKIEPVMITDRWYNEELPPLKAAFEDERILIPRDADHLLDLAAFKVLNGRPTLPKHKTDTVGNGPKRHGDCGIAYALAYHASRAPAESYDYVAAPSRRATELRPGRAYAATTSSVGFKRTRGSLL